ncbi:MAG: ankyrin repeat domain-containing protein [Acidobacteria bacterium]|nr:ankyrin repeat domain-containing protein [Acidobacteriota bacterium]
MSNSKLPERPSLEYLKKLARERLRDLRRTDPPARLAGALLAVAREHGFPSWRALKAEVDARRQRALLQFFDACAAGDVARLSDLLSSDQGLARASRPDAPHEGWTALHAASRSGHIDVVRLLIDHGADPNAREAGDDTLPLHWAAAQGHLDVVRALVEAGSDVHGVGDEHQLEVIGWATLYRASGEPPADFSADRHAIVALLLERGARHHIFSAMSMGNLQLIEALVEQHPDALDRRLSRFERGLTPLHFAIDRGRYDILSLLIELGADLDATDGRGHTSLTTAMLRGDGEAMRRLQAAGATAPVVPAAPEFRTGMAKLAASVTKGVPMLLVPDVARTLDWYTSIGFKELARYADNGLVNFGMVSFGGAELMLNMHGAPGDRDVRLWFYTDQIESLYQLLKSRQLERAQAALAATAAADGEAIAFEQELEHMFYGARQFCIRDPNGYELYFIQSDHVSSGRT